MLRFAFVVGTILTIANVQPAHARAGDLTLTLTGGTGWQASSPNGRIPSNVMVAPGIELIGHALRFDVGFIAALPDVDGNPFNIEVRPSLVGELPVLPIYGRLTAGFVGLAHGPVAMAIGPSVGIRGHIGDLSILGELGFVPIIRSSTQTSIVEARLGVGFGI